MHTKKNRNLGVGNMKKSDKVYYSTYDDENSYHDIITKYLS